MSVVNILEPGMSIARISKAMRIPRSFIYYRRRERYGKRKPRVPDYIEAEINRLSSERTTYGYRRIWALLRNSGTRVNIKTGRRIMMRNNLALPYAKHKKRTRRKDLTIRNILTGCGRPIYITSAQPGKACSTSCR